MYVEIKDRDGQSHQEAVIKALVELKKQVKKSGLLQELKRREFYMSPSKKKRFRHNEAIKRLRRETKTKEWHSKGKQQNDFKTKNHFDGNN